MSARGAPRSKAAVAGESASLRALAGRANFRFWNTDILRVSDLDTQGHVNNAVHGVLFTNGRYLLIQHHLRSRGVAVMPLALARITIEYLREMHFPGEVECGTLVRSIGRSSVTFGQALFNAGRCVAVAEAVMVLVDSRTRRPRALPRAMAAKLKRFTSKLTG